MKTFFGIFFFLLALNNLQAGCPNLAGTYDCPHLKEGQTVNIVQTIATDSTINHAFLKEDQIRYQFMTNGIKRTNSIHNFIYRAYCSENRAVAHFVAEYDRRWQQQISYSLTEDGSLRIEATLVNLKTGKTHGDSHVCSVKKS